METLSMSKAELARLAAVQRLEDGSITQAEVARQLRISVRQLKRLCRAYRLHGPAGLVSKRRGRPSNHRLPADRVQQALELVRTRYPDFGPTFAREKLAQRDGIVLGRETLRKAMIEAQLWQPSRKRRAKVHQPRERRPCRGELVQGDGSPHDWFEGRGPRCSLLLFVDDASSAIGAARFAPTESTDSYFALTRDYVLQHGKPLAFYVDKLSVFTVTRPSEQDDLTQFTRAMHELDIEVICANSPQAKGRVERANRTLQDRLVKELRLSGISSIDDANAFLPEFIARYNERFAVLPRSAVDAHRSLSDTDRLDATLCRWEERRVSKNLTFKYYGTLFQLDEPERERRLRYQHVRVLEHPSGITVEYKGRPLAFRSAPLAQRPVAGAKQISAVLDRSRLGPRAPDPKKQHRPAANHPWRAGYTPPAPAL
jgi:transposase